MPPKAHPICNLFLNAAISIAIAAPVLSAQVEGPNAKPLEFDAVSIRLNKSGDSAGSTRLTSNGFYVVNMPLSTLIYPAFNQASNQQPVYGAPAWLSSERYDLEAKVASSDLETYHRNFSRERNRMLQAVFEDRLKLKAHQETRELPIYALVQAKN